MLEDTSGDRRGQHQRVRKWATDADEIVPPSGYRVVEVDTESCGEIRDLVSYRRDLELAECYMAAFGDVDSDRRGTERMPNDALIIAALTLYGRAFANGVRGARVIVDDLEETQKEAHDFFIDLRNKYVAHAVNAYEQTTVIAYLTDSAFALPEITRVGQRHTDIVAVDEEDRAEFVELCKFHIRRLQTRIERLHREVQEELWNKGKDAVYALPDLGTPAGLQRADVRLRRKL
jgi:hypothetical protein